MSGIYIPKLPFPDTGKQLHFSIQPDGTVYTDWSGSWNEYHAIAVPDHGRLIDADSFKNYMMQAAIDSREDALTDEIHRRVMDAAKALLLDIDEAPTVIPADKEATEE